MSDANEQRDSIVIGEAMFASTLAETSLRLMVTAGLLPRDVVTAMLDAALLQFEEFQHAGAQPDAVAHCRGRIEGLLERVSAMRAVAR